MSVLPRALVKLPHHHLDWNFCKKILQ